MFRPRTPAGHVDALARDLDTGRPSPDNETMAALARVLGSATRRTSDEAYHEATRQRMLRAFDRAGAAPVPASAAAGSRDGAPPTTHTAEVPLPGGGRVLLADVEPIPTGRARASSDTVVLDVWDFVPDERL